MSDKEFNLLKSLFPPEIFDLDFKEKALAHFQKLLHDSQNGDEEAKAKLEGYHRQQAKMQETLAKWLNISQEELKRILANKENYSQEEWESIQEAAKEMSPALKEASKGSLKSKKKKKRKEGWTKS